MHSGQPILFSMGKERPNRKWLLLFALWLTVAGCQEEPSPPEEEVVILVHGLARTEHSMTVLSWRLQLAGYLVASVSYESRSADLAAHAEELRRAVKACCQEAHKLHFVGHSLGSIVIRRYLADTPPDSLGRVVWLAPPNRGSELADWVREFPLAAEAMGPAGRALGTDSTDLHATLPPPSYEVGIVTGNSSVNPVGSALIPGPDDGAVGVERARLEGVPTLVLPKSHSFIMNSRHTADAVVSFLQTGSFGSGEAPTPDGG